MASQLIDVAEALRDATDLMTGIQTVDKKVTGKVVATSEESSNISSTGRPFMKVAFMASVVTEASMQGPPFFHVHVYGDRSLFLVGNILSIANTSLNGRILYVNTRSRVYR